MNIVITGAAGFIGSALVRHILTETSYRVVCVDCLTYAGNLASLAPVSKDKRFRFEEVDICSHPTMARVFEEHRPHAIVHLAAESHVDRSIDGPMAFCRTNVVGTAVLLEVARSYWGSLSAEEKSKFRFHHVSTDEVYGDLHGTEDLFTEQTPYAPSSPYAATKAASDHLVRAWHRTYGLPTLVSNCSNNYGPYQFPEKLIPHIILNAIQGRPLPVYGSGDHVRDWLYVDDHARALVSILSDGKPGETYNVGGHNEQRNIDVVHSICDLLEEMAAAARPSGIQRYHDLITFVPDRPGHDRRYAIDASKIDAELGWRPQESFASGLRKTVSWYLQNREWWAAVLSGDYRLDRIGKGD